MTKKIVIDEDACMSCGACQGVSDGTNGGYFDLASVVAKAVKDYDETDAVVVEEAMNGCPAGAISIEE
jgi:ferredoxin